MKRGKPLERKTGLKADPEKTRAFIERGRGALQRTGSGMRRVTAGEGPLTPAEWRAAVFAAAHGRCIISGTRARDLDDPRFQAHHILPKRVLRVRGLLSYVWDARNGLWLRADVHAAHEAPGVNDGRIPAYRLPTCVWEFCDELDALAGTHWATDLVLRAHPAAGHGGTQEEAVRDGESRR
jgi:hypothetical protein